MRRSYDRLRRHSEEVEYELYLTEQAEQERIDAEEAAHRNRTHRDLCPVCSREDCTARCEDDPGDRDLTPEPPYRDPGWAA